MIFHSILFPDEYIFITKSKKINGQMIRHVAFVVTILYQFLITQGDLEKKNVKRKIIQLMRSLMRRI